MSRLDSFIHRVTAQREILNFMIEQVQSVPGTVLELGLGNGRTFDHIREALPDREIFVFDRAIRANPRCVPDGEHMILGEIRDTLEFCGPRIREKAAFIHCDLGSGDPTTDLATQSWISPLIALHSAPGALIASGLALDLPGYEVLPLPGDVQEGRYFLYRAPAQTTRVAAE